MTSSDPGGGDPTGGGPRETVLRALAAELPVGPLARRRILAELADHIDDAVDDLRRSGLPRDEAMREAVRRLGDAETIARTFGATRTRAARWSRVHARRSLAWMMVAAMSAVTTVAAELPQASGAKPPARLLAPASRRVTPPVRRTAPRPVTRASTVAGHGHRAERR